MGFKNARKATSYAAEAAAEKLANDARRLGFAQVPTHALLYGALVGCVGACNHRKLACYHQSLHNDFSTRQPH